MVQRVRAFFADYPIGIVIPVGVIALYVSWIVISSAVGAFVYPVLVQLTGRNPSDFNGTNRFGLEFDFLGITFRPDAPLINAISAAVLLTFVYWMFVRPLPDSEVDEEEWRECPECRSEISVAATRCAFCTTAIAPLFESEDTASGPPSVD